MNIPTLRAIIPAAFCLFALTVRSQAVDVPRNMTNAIPSGVFVTDDGKLFWSNSSGQRLMPTNKINAAQKSPESRPADEDPEGSWGRVQNGFQLSIRTDKRSYAVGEPIKATILLRNVTNTPLVYVCTYASD